MEAVKGKLLNKLKTMAAERILQANALHFYSPHKLPAIHEDPNTQEPDLVDDQEPIDDKENVKPPCPTQSSENQKQKRAPLSEIDVSLFRPPDLNSETLFDPNLLAAFRQAVSEAKERRSGYVETSIFDEPPLKLRKVTDPFTGFKEICPPGGDDSIVLYTTSIGGIRRTFENCQKVRSLLENLRVIFFERDMSMHSEFKEELWRISGERLLPPRLFIKGRYIGGADEVLGMHERGELKPLMEGMPVDTNEGPCEGCFGIRFVVCFNCNGSRRIAFGGGDELGSIDCSECNENGMIICPFCC